MRSSTLVLAVVIALSATGVFAQEVAQATQGPAPKPPAAAGAEATKPTRGFFSSLGHNLKDDVKHLPRKNSLYFLVRGSAGALLVHPNDNKINRRLEGSGAAETFFKPRKIIGETPVLPAGVMAGYLIGRGKGNGRLQHLGRTRIDAEIL